MFSEPFEFCYVLTNSLAVTLISRVEFIPYIICVLFGIAVCVVYFSKTHRFYLFPSMLMSKCYRYFFRFVLRTEGNSQIAAFRLFLIMGPEALNASFASIASKFQRYSRFRNQAHLYLLVKTPFWSVFFVICDPTPTRHHVVFCVF